MRSLDDIPRGGDEQTQLNAWLDYYRATLVDKCADLTDEQLTGASCPPSPMSLIGLVRHLTEMEIGYAHRLTEPGKPLHYCDVDEDGDFEDVAAGSVQADLLVYDAACAHSRDVMSGLSLEDTFGRSGYTLRWVYLYLIKEYARHLGHADLLRERIDGATGE